MTKVRLGIIGMGGMGTDHFNQIKKIENIEVTALCDLDEKRIAFFDGKKFSDYHKLIISGVVDAVCIATPHYVHTPAAIDALQNGLHVLVEKPIAVHVNDAKKMIAAHTDKKLKFAAMFNQRTNPIFQKIKQLVSTGELGEMRRINWIATDWFRSYAYYASGGWRATWKGEGGGVLLNQCPHNLDLLQWITGLPKKVTAFIGLGKYHDIEVEDEVNAFLEYENGATGVFITTAGEAPGTNRFEIAGERGKLVLEKGKLHFTRNEVETTQFSKTTSQRFGVPPVWEIDIPVSGPGEQHTGIHKNFRDAILNDAPLVAPAEEGIRSLELGNAMLLSGLQKKTMELPLDGEALYCHLKNLIETSRFVKQKTVEAQDDLGASFKH
ncbi:MAG: oxidoreductase [Candidatus Raymondbacteria bacterium RIFOXYA2_FULL_49_16]|uniref:Oxidoreductase n=1 Tax=Candidatus Raymondbacteria bacterium RIFOXYD12_FULL_49_13 TaxID=1817890 RepID=A0A1F7FHT3_UNCRA|nr:MAG: oxidoreductase [Candidatus Raymondbacteria bacterium RIFOXYA2_FULL_49_16]OGJ97166.1 MAG: oxidoreductase [Candidatus Raymondbacteria bacterium RIFOXYC2_FULL_50_21]OGK06141.1 MAG: oxidoreductase [Candidatus Raymondbacteria bacterium RIFOXYD12_FULL_49_13]OGP42897.1 MAG: oxidoreductase [Candidatus Raymondbacteria bacterium RIFOXYB2_FULL_49_35]